MHKHIRPLFIACVMLLAWPTFAVPVSGLYQGVVPVKSQDASLRDAAVQQALAQVFVKVSGNSNAISTPDVQTALKNPDNYLLSYSYADQGNQGLLLDIAFDPKSINSILQNAQQGVWGKNRPRVLVWFVQSQSGAAPQIISSNNDSPALDQLKLDAKLRGLPLLMPMLDLTDIQAVSPGDITSVNMNAIQQASGRYGADAILLVNLVQNGSQYQTTWTLLAQGNNNTWQSNGNLADVVNTGINDVSDSLANTFAVVSQNASQTQFQLTVMNVQNLADYARVTDYLKGLTPVRDADLVQIQPTVLTYQLTVAGGEAALERALSLDHRLQAVTVAPSLNSSGSGLVYQWLS